MIGTECDNFKRIAIFSPPWLHTDMEIQCYAQRLLNPFRGVINVIRYQSAEAVTMDGVHWDIYVANEALSAGLKGKAQISDIRYGSWSEADGLKRGPIYPSEDFRRMEQRGHIVFDYLRQHHGDVPFAFADHFELWLLDSARRPLALIHSVLTQDEMTMDVPRLWRAGFAAEAQFRSSAIAEPENSAATLAAQVNRRSASWQWIARDASGGGMGMAGGAGSEQGAIFSAQDFPEGLLAQNPEDAGSCGLVKDYLDWLAPCRLLLPGLEPEARAAIESLARLRAAEMVRQHRLYPAIADPSQLKAAQVELVLRDKQPATQEKTNASTSPFYIELNPQGGGYT